jgi:hypothetical protein
VAGAPCDGPADTSFGVAVALLPGVAVALVLRLTGLVEVAVRTVRGRTLLPPAGLFLRIVRCGQLAAVAFPSWICHGASLTGRLGYGLASCPEPVTRPVRTGQIDAGPAPVRAQNAFRAQAMMKRHIGV